MGEGPQNRMGAALGAALALVRESYLSRDQVCLVTFRDNEARVAVPPTTSITLLRQRLKRLAIGGATPLADGLRKSLQVARQARLKHSGIDPLLVIISDGEATSAMTPGGDPVQEALDTVRELRRERIPAIMIDTSNGLKAPGIMPRMAEILGTGCHRLHALTAGKVLELIDRSAMETEE
jgi:Mg-chelatase subunit ChlD